jgi:hypothetical protein
MTTDSGDPQPTTQEDDQPPSSRQPGLPGRILHKLAHSRVGRVPVLGILAAVVAVALIGAAYQLGSPPASSDLSALDKNAPIDVQGRYAGVPMPAATAAPAQPENLAGGFSTSDGSTSSTPADQAAITETTQIVKTGSMQLEVPDLDKAVSAAQAKIVGLGGYVSDSSRSGGKDSAVATVTYRLPVTKWDDALAAMRGLASTVLSEQTNTADVTSQVIDLDARLNNLKVTESALQAIMARATAVTDVLAVEQQLSQVQGQIEQLTAQRDHLKDQAAMSTLAVSFSTPTTVTTQTAQEWDLGAQVDQAAAALIRIGQGLATIAVWLVIVGIPVVVSLLALGIVLWIVRRIFGRRRRAAAQA